MVETRKSKLIELQILPVETGLPAVREESGKFRVKEKSGNFVLGHGILKKVSVIWGNL